MGQLLSQPLSEKSVNVVEDDLFSYCIGSMQGYRLTQEDAHSALHERTVRIKQVNGDFKECSVRVYGVYDGHGGAQTSNWISERLPLEIIKQLGSDDAVDLKFTTDVGLRIHRMKQAFFQTDYDVYDKLRFTNSGSTAIVAVIIDNTDLYVLNTGDSRLIVSTAGGYAKNLSYDHKPNNLGEMTRINDAGGRVTYNRVGGILALSRAFGDFSFKLRTAPTMGHSTAGRITLPSEETQVTVEPEVLTHILSSKDEFIVLACDGIWDVFSNKDIIHYVRHRLALGMSLSLITTQLLDHSISLADHKTGVGFDNMSIIIIACQLPNESLQNWHDRMKLEIELSSGITK